MTRNKYYYSNSPETSCIYNPNSKKWNCTNYYVNGKVNSNYYCDSSSYMPVGLKIVYDLKSNIVYSINFYDELLNGSFREYYCNQRLKISGEFYNSFRTGKWYEYYPNGILKSVKEYELSKQDSLYFKQNSFKDTIRNCSLKISYVDYDFMDSLESKIICYPNDSLINPACTDEYSTKNGNKTGMWLYYDYRGKLIKKLNFSKKNKINYKTNR